MSSRIMVVDDDPVVVRLVRGILENEGYQVETASDGLDALVAIQETSPDLVILDVMMPEINGYDVAYQLRFNDQFKRIPILLLTSRQKELDDKITERAHMDYVSKPVDAQLLLSKVASLLT